MSLGFGKVPVDAWDKVKAGNREDEVPSGDYFARFTGLKHFDAAKSKKGTGTYTAEFTITRDAEHKGKHVSLRANYHPEPEGGWVTTNAISMQKLAQLVAACPEGEAKLVVGGEGYDVIATLEAIAATEPEVLITIDHSESGGKRYQDVTQVKAVTSA